VIFRQDDIVQHRPYVLVIDPEQNLCLGHARLDIKVIAMEGHTAIAVGGAGKEGMGEFLRERLWRIGPALRRAQDLARDGRQALVSE
jgi:hypothetical protein